MVAYEEKLKKGYESNDTAKGVLAPRHVKHHTENQRHLYIRMCAEYEIMLEEMRIYKLETSLKQCSTNTQNAKMIREEILKSRQALKEVKKQVTKINKKEKV